MDNDSLSDCWSNFVLQRLAKTDSPERFKHLEQSHFDLSKRIGHGVDVDADAGNSARCTCRTVNHARRWQPLSILHFIRTFRTQHFPEYMSSEQTLEFTMQLVPPSWLLCHTINVGFQLKNLRTTRGFAICPIILGTTRLVEARFSLAFRAILDTKEELYDTKLHHIAYRGFSILYRVYSTSRRPRPLTLIITDALC